MLFRSVAYIAEFVVNMLAYSGRAAIGGRPGERQSEFYGSFLGWFCVAAIITLIVDCVWPLNTLRYLPAIRIVRFFRVFTYLSAVRSIAMISQAVSKSVGRLIPLFIVLLLLILVFASNWTLAYDTTFTRRCLLTPEGIAIASDSTDPRFDAIQVQFAVEQAQRCVTRAGQWSVAPGRLCP